MELLIFLAIVCGIASPYFFYEFLNGKDDED